MSLSERLSRSVVSSGVPHHFRLANPLEFACMSMRELILVCGKSTKRFKSVESAFLVNDSLGFVALCRSSCRFGCASVWVQRKRTSETFSCLRLATCPPVQKECRPLAVQVNESRLPATKWQMFKRLADVCPAVPTAPHLSQSL